MKGLGFGKKKKKGEEGGEEVVEGKKGPKQMAAGKYKMDDIMGGKTEQQKEEILKRFNPDGSVKSLQPKGKRPQTKGINWVLKLSRITLGKRREKKKRTRRRESKC